MENSNKKGISPLIATVLLIGFSVALAAVVMTWGLDYIKASTDQVGDKTQEALKCATQLDFEIVSADCDTSEVVIQNNGVIDIATITFRVHTGGDITPTTNEEPLQSLALKTYEVDLSGSSKVDAIASILGTSGQPILCKDAVEEFITGCS